MPTTEKRFTVLFSLLGTRPLLMDFISVGTTEELVRRTEAKPLVLLPPVPREGAEDAERMTGLRQKAERYAEKHGAETISGMGAEIRPRLQEIAAGKISYNEKKEIIIPGLALYACLRNAGEGVKISGKTPVTWKSGGTSLPCYVQLDDESYSINSTSWEPHFCFLANKADRQKKGDYGIAVYPRFDKWSIDGTMEVVCEDGFTVEHARKLLTEAGRLTGLGAMRGERKGYVNFGSFEVKEFEFSPSNRLRMSLQDFQQMGQAK